MKLGVTMEMSDLSRNEILARLGESYKMALLATIKSLEFDTNSSEGKTIAAQLAWLMNEKSEAVNLAAQAVMFDPKNFEAHYVFGLFKPDAASIDKAIELNPAFTPAYAVKIENLLTQAADLKGGEQKAKYEIALETIKSLLSLSPPDADFWREQQAALVALQKIEHQPLTRNDNLENSTRLNLITRPGASYTEAARRAQVQGTVRLLVIFGADGQIKGVLPLKVLPFGMTQQAIKAVKQIRFEPEIRNGVPVDVTKILEYNFNLF